jgi:predicted RNA-binding protein with PIN domain
MRYYVDGYNVIYKSSVLRPLALQDYEAAREALIDMVAQLCAATHQHITIVFDGKAQHFPALPPHQRGAKTLHVVYSSNSLSADSVIEREVYKAPNRLELCVVSNDRGLRDLCRNMGALTMEADSFLATVNEVSQDIHQNLERTRAPAPASLQDVLDPESMERLRRLRDEL